MVEKRYDKTSNFLISIILIARAINNRWYVSENCPESLNEDKERVVLKE
jgi:hypothetical protein